MSRPYISIVIPTRDRPELMYYTLKSLSVQTADDFEVIVSDNFVKTPCKDVFDEFERPNFRYVKPPQSLSMCDHWDFALSHARGEYVSFVQDKHMLYHDAIKQITNICVLERPDIISWIVDVTDCPEESNMDKVGFYGALQTRPMEAYSPSEELKRRRREAWNTFDDGYSGWYRGKILYGAYSRDLIAKILDKRGSLFPPISPDITSLSLGLGYANKAIDLCHPLTQLLSIYGNGKKIMGEPGFALKFLSDNWPEQRFELMPIPNLYSSVANWAIYDSYANLGRNCEMEFDDVNFQLLAEEASKDLALSYPWANKEEKEEQMAVFNAFVAKHNLEMPDQSKWLKADGTAKSDDCAATLKNALKKLYLFKGTKAIYNLFSQRFVGPRFEVYKLLGRCNSLRRESHTSLQQLILFHKLRYWLGVSSVD
jgi:glycosyltransferase involved in cell wall biosynthesis